MADAILPPLPVIPNVEVRHIPGWPGYAVSDDGRVFSCRMPGVQPNYRLAWREMRQAKNPIYTTICLRHNQIKKTLYVHHLVLETFVSPRPPGCEACHENDIKEDNQLRNLRWATKIENQADKRINGHLPMGETHFRTTITADDVRQIRLLFHDGVMQPVLAARFRLHQTTISDICRRKHWQHI